MNILKNDFNNLKEKKTIFYNLENGHNFQNFLLQKFVFLLKINLEKILQRRGILNNYFFNNSKKNCNFIIEKSINLYKKILRKLTKNSFFRQKFINFFICFLNLQNEHKNIFISDIKIKKFYILPHIGYIAH